MRALPELLVIHVRGSSVIDLTLFYYLLTNWIGPLP